VTRLEDYTVLVGLDNNYPGGNGRVPGVPDGTEIIALRFSQPIAAIPEAETYAMFLLGLGLGLVGWLSRRRA
jgi:hypothetical protein